MGAARGRDLRPIGAGPRRRRQPLRATGKGSSTSSFDFGNAVVRITHQAFDPAAATSLAA